MSTTDEARELEPASSVQLPPIVKVGEVEGAGCTDTSLHGDGQRDVADRVSLTQETVRTGQASLSAPVPVEQVVRTAPTETSYAAAADARFEMRLQRRHLHVWRAIAHERGVSVANMVRAAVAQYASAEHAAELAGPDIAALTAELRALRAKGPT